MTVKEFKQAVLKAMDVPKGHFIPCRNDCFHGKELVKHNCEDFGYPPSGCPHCNMTGWTARDCPTCGGEGEEWVTEDEGLEIFGPISLVDGMTAVSNSIIGGRHG